MNDRRHDDLIWTGNGLLAKQQQEGTVVVPHFAILSVDSDPVTSQQSPPTYIYGDKHENAVQTLLQKYHCRTARVDSFAEISTRAALKVLWASCLWLICHKSQPPLTVSQVHTTCPDVLEQLVQELLPALAKVIDDQPPALPDILDYFESYSLSMPQAIPSLDLARAELVHRNGIFGGKGTNTSSTIAQKRDWKRSICKAYY